MEVIFEAARKHLREEAAFKLVAATAVSPGEPAVKAS